MTYYGNYQAIVDEFGGSIPSTYFTQTVIQERLLPRIRHRLHAELGAYYDVPFDDVALHPKGVPATINHIANSVAKRMIQTTTEGDKKPRKVGSLDNLNKMIREELKRIKLAYGSDIEEMVYGDGTIVARKATHPVPAIQQPTETLAQNWDIIDDDGVDSNVYYDEDN